MPVSDQLIDQLLADYKSPEDLLGEQGLLKQLTKKLAERALEAEMEQHLGYAITHLDFVTETQICRKKKTCSPND